MWLYFIGYMVLGAVCWFFVSWYAISKKSVSTFLEALSTFHPMVVLITIFLWPPIVLFDLLVRIPEERKILLRELRSTRRKRHHQRDVRHEERAKYEQLIGLVGHAVGDLRLAGEVIIEDQNWPAVSQDGYIESGTRIVVAGYRDKKLQVRIAPEA